MCGILGIWYKDRCPINLQLFQSALDKLRHRGPDDEGYLLVNIQANHVFPCGGKDTDLGLNLPAVEGHFGKIFDLVLGFRRLSILDLSPAGHQPMGNEDGSIWIVHNGEIYNYVEIRKELERIGHRFITQTDTEVILHAYEEWGIECLRRFNGMWAFAIIDLKAKRLFCSRDRAGVKPFYYLDDGKKFCFASEIKALLLMDGFSIEPNDPILADYLFSGMVDHTAETFFKNIYQLRPGDYLLFEDNKLTIRSYWDIEAKEVRYPREDDYSERFYDLLQDSVRLRLRSDVPIGSCLSGGIDSSTIVCLANKLMFDGQHIDPRLVGERQKTFSSCFEDTAYDERNFIEKVIAKTGAEKNYVFPEPKTLFGELTRLIWHQDEPFSSMTVYAHWNVMRLAQERVVKVLLNGQGADELLAGYMPSFYFMMKGVLKEFDFSRFIKEMVGLVKYHGNELKQFIPGMLIAIAPMWAKPSVREFIKKDIGWSTEGLRKRYLRNTPETQKFTEDLNNYLYQVYRYAILPGLLHYEDRNSMAFSIETRLPFLDYRLVEYAFALPLDQKIKGGVTKVVLRNAMKNILPEEVRNRKDKMGFVTPEGIWFRTLLKGQIRDLISSKSFAERGYFNVNEVKKSFEEHCKGKINISPIIWRWVNLELWFRTFIDQEPSSHVWEKNGN